MEDVIFTVLNDNIDANIYPDRPAQDLSLPYIVYSRQDFEPFLSLSGAIDLGQFTIRLEFWTDTYAGLQSLMTETKTLLHGYTGERCQGCFLHDSTTQEEEQHFHGSQTYFLYGNTEPEEEGGRMMIGGGDFLLVGDGDNLIWR